MVPILLISGIILWLAYRYYGSWLSRKLGIDDRNITPAHTRQDGVDYVPGKVPVVLGHHFASIAGAGPIVGPVIAVAFGWIPALLWILVGGIFFGAVHDITSLMASIRHQGKSIGFLIQSYIGEAGKNLFLIFAFATLLLIVAVFMDIVAKTFVNVPSAASASLLFMLLALVFGFVMTRYRISFWLLTLSGVIIMFLMIWIGLEYPLNLSYPVWIVILVVYIFAAAVTPVHILLQPRDYLNSFLLYGMMFFGIAGILVMNPEIGMSGAVSFEVESLGYLFPVLFVTIACGAISGFHSLVASGTTSKQIDLESDAKKVGYGAMLIESLLAVVAVCSVIVLSREQYFSSLASAGPVTLFSEGVGGFMTGVGIPLAFGISFVALTVSAFALTSLDTCTRLARFVVQEYADGHSQPIARYFAGNRYAGTLLVVILGMSLLLTGQFQELWPIFGSANQLLAALALLAVTVWLIKTNVNPVFTMIPMVFMFAVTLSSLFLFAWNHFSAGGYTLGIVAGILFGLSIALMVLARKSLAGFKQSITESPNTA
jgi:carbon starvation protein